ncbi:hypothetical protein [Chlorobaculum sp. 24CR]|uniref:hypothetical protein n=1 Tax=Chlorobaculum sp. 24CR TaxID=2508878 RepID=UPI001430905B|nr:hypothetical protein [Chlorobaculum sp. 24CR]
MLLRVVAVIDFHANKRRRWSFNSFRMKTLKIKPLSGSGQMQQKSGYERFWLFDCF